MKKKSIRICRVVVLASLLGGTWMAVADDEISARLQTPPKRGPEIREIGRISHNSLLARFGGEEVWQIDWAILNARGKVVASGSLQPSNNTPEITYADLPSGAYTLVFRGQASKKTSKLAFEIPKPRVVNMGVIETTAGGRQLRMVNALHSHVELLPSGAVRLSYPETQPSLSGKNQTRAWVFDSYMTIMKPDDLKALTSPKGLMLPAGGYTFYIYYFDVADKTAE